MSEAKEEMVWASGSGVLARGETFVRVLNRRDVEAITSRSVPAQRNTTRSLLGILFNPLSEMMPVDARKLVDGGPFSLFFTFETFDPDRPNIMHGTWMLGDTYGFGQASHSRLMDEWSEWSQLDNVFFYRFATPANHIETALMNSYMRQIQLNLAMSKKKHAVERRELAREIAAKKGFRPPRYRFDDWP